MVLSFSPASILLDGRRQRVICVIGGKVTGRPFVGGFDGTMRLCGIDTAQRPASTFRTNSQLFQAKDCEPREEVRDSE
jgi:hypothetical protein